MRFLPTFVHGVIDYLWAALLLALPFALGLPIGGLESWIAFLFAAGGVVYSLLTRYEVGLVPLIPMPLHLGLDALAGIALAALPFVLAVQGRARYAFVAFGLFAVVASLVTRTRPTGLPQGS